MRLICDENGFQSIIELATAEQAFVGKAQAY